MKEQLKETNKNTVDVQDVLTVLFRHKTDEEISEIIDKFIEERHEI